MEDLVKFKKPLRTWAPNEEDLSFSLNEQHEFAITNKGQLLHNEDFDEMYLEDLRRWETIEADEKIVHTFYLPALSHGHTTDYLRWACEELYPEVDFDVEFETDRPGVVQRIRESEYADIEDKAPQMKLQVLKEKIEELGYELVF